MPVTITIHGEHADETLHNLRTLADGLLGRAPTGPSLQEKLEAALAAAPAAEPEKSEKASRQRKQKEQPPTVIGFKPEDQIPQGVVETATANLASIDQAAIDQATAQINEPVVISEKPADDTPLTADSFRPLVIGACAIDGIGMPTLQKVIASYGGKKIGDLPVEKLPTLKAEIEALIVKAGHTVEATLAKGNEVLSGKPA